MTAIRIGTFLLAAAIALRALALSMPFRVPASSPWLRTEPPPILTDFALRAAFRPRRLAILRVTLRIAEQLPSTSRVQRSLTAFAFAIFRHVCLGTTTVSETGFPLPEPPSREPSPEPPPSSGRGRTEIVRVAPVAFPTASVAVIVTVRSPAVEKVWATAAPAVVAPSPKSQPMLGR